MPAEELSHPLDPAARPEGAGSTRRSSGGLESPTCSVVVCTRDRPGELDRCLESLGHVDYPGFDVIVVDNAPRDERTREVVARQGAAYVIEPVPGLSRARNRGARFSNREVIAFLDDDAVAEPGWLSALAQEFRDPMVMAVTGRICALRIETAAERAWASIAGSSSGGPERRVVGPGTPQWFEMANFGGVGDGGNMAFRRRAFDVWPGFDERLGRGAPVCASEEHYAFFSLIERGYKVAYTPNATVRHPYPGTFAELRARQLRHLTSAAAYMTLMFVEQPRYRRSIIRYVVEALRGARREWRGQETSARKPPHLVPLWRMLLASGCGPLVYLSLQLQGAVPEDKVEAGVQAIAPETSAPTNGKYWRRGKGSLAALNRTMRRPWPF